MTFSVTGALATVIGAVLIVIGVVLYTGTGGRLVPFYDYGITIDAGSSHSEVTLYKWGEDKKVIEKGSCSTRPGIDKISPTNGNLNKLLDCVEKMASEVHGARDATPVILGATAGMRILEAENKTLTDEILKTIDEGLKSIKLNNTELNVEMPRIIPGEDEGLFAWVTANYLLKIIPPEKRLANVSADDTMGILDMGGASAQIAFAESPEKANTKAKLFGKTYNVKAYSNLCYGMDQAVKRYFSLLIKDFNFKAPSTSDNSIKLERERIGGGDIPDVNPETVSSSMPELIPDPCSNEGVEHKIDGSDLLHEVCVNKPDGNPPSNYISSKLAYIFRGAPDLDKCKHYVEKLTKLQECRENFQICPTINTNGIPKGANFYAFSNYYFVTRVIPYLKNHSSISLPLFQDSVKNFCYTKWSTIEPNVEKICETNANFCKRYCFGLNFVEKTLSDIYNFALDQWLNIHFAKKLEGKSLGWALGDMLVACNAMPGAKPTKPVLPLYGMVLMIVVGVVLLVFGLANLYHRHRSRRSYESV
ncbi:ectonucleoside triphosphate diphosphohydrolase 3-like protein [Dinothrombium tinctorium]|uniref:Ectonucleoside triphosphate diphosphohydrolase 3-like protein n=1 Tax=Dinothrombium tinctorium TaxID=1965070 RepID=A0A443QSY3_9ACAR|nr:ectonucleoside triphosphate diphosphohydrolase 3-like protein [Dinothrombium tinctorium]